VSAAQVEPWITAPGAVLVDVRLTPRGGRDAVEGIARRADGRVVLKARVRAPAHEGEANAALCRLLARATGSAPGQVTVVAGAAGRTKRVRIAGNASSLDAALRRIVQEGANRA
jgi:uncharacterized protein (TIGR00251 family)